MKECAVYRSSHIIGKKWTIEIMLELYKGEKEEKRFNELKRKLGSITPTALSTRLNELEKEGMIEKHIDTSVLPGKSEYYLTECGKEFIQVIRELKKWSAKWKFREMGCEEAFCKCCGI
ncbi:MAG: helix-turn-helix domain-containing protein [Methanosarcinaceae archaeon]|nr:helix-turn-helix domain-containing protein [Methanosarcinaceae archaeon]